MTVQSKPLGTKWKARLDLANRKAPELYENAEDVKNTPHAGAIRTTLQELGASAVFCVQGVPTIAILSVEDYDREAIVNLHGALWNQGLASLLLVFSGDTVRAFSLARIPYSGMNEEFDRRCLVQELNAITHALELKDIIYGAESGRLWEKHASYFRPKERIDQVLLNNLVVSHRILCGTGLSSDAAQALLIQAMFIAYLEDREIITPEYFLSASSNLANSFTALLSSGNVQFLNCLFESLVDDFDGDLFVAPCSFETSIKPPRVTRSHMEILTRFRSGREDMMSGTGQYRFWGYNFKYIPIELISAVYDRFLGQREAKKREHGAYYTPMFLADTVISQVWDILPDTAKDKGLFLDPACGSGVFLVRSFQRLCEHWRETRKSRTIRWDSLLTILSRLQGWDRNGAAVRVAVFSLYIALLEEISPPEIRLLVKRGKFLPGLWERNLIRRDFFGVSPDQTKVDVVIGNPPWSSRRGTKRSSVEWCRANNLPIPEGEDAWAFVWKSLQHLAPNGILALLLPAMSFLHNLAPSSFAARRLLLEQSRLLRVINFADLRFQLFNGPVRSAALVLAELNPQPNTPYTFEYWTPKADINLKIKRFITLGAADKRPISSRMAAENALIFKHHLWMRAPDAKLFNYLSRYEKLSREIEIYKDVRRNPARLKKGWVIGYGFQPDRGTTPIAQRLKLPESKFVGKLPYLPIEAFVPFAQSTGGLKPWKSSTVWRLGFEESYVGLKVLIPRGVGTAKTRLRASFTDKSLTYQHSIQAISIPKGDEDRGKLLTALLNSRVAVWFAFHGTASFGSERPEVQQADLLRLPFPSLQELPDQRRAENAARALIGIIDRAIQAEAIAFHLKSDDHTIYAQIDHLSYEYFCLSDDEITLIDDAVEKIIPAVQPSQGSFPDIWQPADREDREAYATTLVRSMSNWFDGSSSLGIKLEARNNDLAILRLTLEEGHKQIEYVEENDRAVGEVLSGIFEHIHRPLAGNFQLMPDFRVFIGKNLYLVKPTQKRFWLKSAALADADAIALDLQDTAGFSNRRSHE